MPPPSNAKHPAPVPLLDEMAAVLPSQVQTPEQTGFAQSATQEIQRALTRLSAKTQRFRCTGLCRLGVQQGDVEEDLLLPIRSVPFDTTIRLLEEGYVEPPRSKKMNVETMEFDMVRDEWDPGYQRKLQQANMLFLKRYTLYALDCELEDEQGKIVWDPQAGVYDEPAALRVLDLQGLTQTHYTQIREDAERLSMSEQQRQDAARKKRS